MTVQGITDTIRIASGQEEDGDLEARSASAMRLPKIVLLNGPNVAKVERWYDKESRNWVTQKVNKQGVQVGHAEFDGNETDAAVAQLWMLSELVYPPEAEAVRHLVVGFTK